MVKKFILLILISLSIALYAWKIGLSTNQCVAMGVFLMSVLGTLFFWDFRLGFVFVGTSLLLITRTLDIEHLIRYASLEVILFLVGMMVLVGLMKEKGFFAWIVQLILRVKKMTAIKFVVVISVTSALLSTMTSEVVSIIFMVAAVLEICDYFEVDPVPFIIVAVLATNIGSAATVLGNPIGILIASKAGLTFEDFILKAFPLSVLCLISAIIVMVFLYKNVLTKMDENIKRIGENEMLMKLISVPPGKELRISLCIFGITILFISFHHRLELLLRLEPNTILLTMPLLMSGLVMVWKWRKAREYIEKDVEWWTLLFFMMLFAQAGALQYSGVTDELANRFIVFAKSSNSFMIGLILWVSTIGSSILDNVVLVAALIPVIQSFKTAGVNVQPLWWALLFGGCLGGNITLVGSTANIVAIGILEKEKNIRMTFMRWFGIGITVGIITTAIVWAALMYIPYYNH